MNLLIFFYDELVIFLPSFDSPGNQRWGVCYELKICCMQGQFN